MGIQKGLSAVLLFLGAVSGAAQAAQTGHPFGAGIIIGEPTGLSAQYFMNSRNSIDGALAWDYTDNEVLHLHGDYLWHKPKVIPAGPHGLDLFYGIGARFLVWSHDYYHPHHYHHHDHGTVLGVRVPVGLSYKFSDPRIEIFGELAAGVDIIPGLYIDLDAGVGVRFYF